MPNILTGGEKNLLVGASETARQLGDIGLLGSQGSKSSNTWMKTYTSYSGCDIIAVINLQGKLLQIGNLSTISYSIHREKQPVRTCGRIYPKTYVRGNLTIAGTLIFTVFNEHVLSQLRNVFDYENVPADTQKSLLPHQFPPFDVVITYANEYGHTSYLKIYGVEIIDEGQSHSVNDMVSENMMQYVARDIDMMISTENSTTDSNLNFAQSIFNSNKGAGTPQISNIENRDKLRNQVFEYEKLILLLEDEVEKWITGENTESVSEWVGGTWSKAQYLNIFRRGGITTIAEAIIFLKENKIKLEEMKKLRDSFSAIQFGHDRVKDNPFDYGGY